MRQLPPGSGASAGPPCGTGLVWLTSSATIPLRLRKRCLSASGRPGGGWGPTAGNWPQSWACTSTWWRLLSGAPDGLGGKLAPGWTGCFVDSRSRSDSWQGSGLIGTDPAASSFQLRLPSPTEFYPSVEKALERRQIPSYILGRKDCSEAGLLSANRVYLRAIRQRLAFDICAAPHGSRYVCSSRLTQKPPTAVWFWLAAIIATCVFVYRRLGAMRPSCW